MATKPKRFHWGALAGQIAGAAAPAPGPAASPLKGQTGPMTLPPPPVGTYDPGINYNAQASQRGYGYAANDAQTQYEQGTEDYGNAVSSLTQQRDRNLADLRTQEGDVHHQYDILGNRQAEAARRQGITSAGLLGLSAQTRSANQAHDLAPIQTAEQRVGENYDTTRNQLALGLARQFGGFNGQLLNDPYTGQPVAGSLLTSLSRAGAENTAYQGYSGTLAAQQAAQGGYISPLLQQADPNAFLKKLLGQR